MQQTAPTGMPFQVNAQPIKFFSCVQLMHCVPYQYTFRPKKTEVSVLETYNLEHGPQNLYNDILSLDTYLDTTGPDT